MLRAISHTSLRVRYWQLLIVALVFYNSFAVPLNIALAAQEVHSCLCVYSLDCLMLYTFFVLQGNIYYTVFNYSVDALFAIDMVLNFITSYEDEFGGFVTHLPDVALRYKFEYSSI